LNGKETEPMNICLEQELEDALTDLLREDYGDKLEGIEDLDDLLTELYDSFHCDIIAVAQNYFRSSIPGLTKETVETFVKNHEPEDDE
tara:strand:- start:652 stop:915 length:264 start_codon:yes stop_codon:yes gene_type:complete